MTPEIRRAALRAAAKVAFVTAVGCGSTAAPPSNTTTTPPPAQACPAYLDTLAIVERDKLAVGDPLRDKPDVYGAFADRAARESRRTHDCCSEELGKGGTEAHRWACCSALGNQVPAGGTPSACIPWGPPCPPTMV